MYNPILGYDVKRISGELKDINIEKRTVSGYFSVFDFKDSDGDIISKGAYKKTIEENGIRGKNRIMHLLQHDPTKPLGKPTFLEEDEYGVKFQTTITDTTYGTDTLKLYDDSVYKEHSVGILVLRRDDSLSEVIKEVIMFEGSTVTWGANELALGGFGKSMEGNKFLERYNTLQKAFYNGTYTDETFLLLEKQKKAMEGMIRDSLLKEEPPLSTPIAEADKIKQYFKDLETKQLIKNLF